MIAGLRDPGALGALTKNMMEVECNKQVIEQEWSQEHSRVLHYKPEVC